MGVVRIKVTGLKEELEVVSALIRGKFSDHLGFKLVEGRQNLGAENALRFGSFFEIHFDGEEREKQDM